MPDVTIVIPNYNGIAYLGACLRSVEKQEGVSAEVLIVDNGSTDGSQEYIRTEFPACRLICLEKNYGFCRAVNEGFRYAGSEYVILLNNDTEIKPDFALRLLASIKKDRKRFSCQACMIQYHDHSKMDDAGDMYTLMGWAFQRGVGRPSGGYNHVCRVFSACAGAAIYRREVFKTIGYFDEMHFAYLEDIDVGYRARHVGSGTSGSRYNSFKVRLAARNNVYLNYKNMPLFQLVLNSLPLGLGILVKYAFFRKIGFGKDYIDGLKEGFKTAKQCRKVKYDKKHLKNYLAIEWGLCTGTLLYIREFLARQAAKL